MSFDYANPIPLAEAVNLLSAKTPIGSILRTYEWANYMPQALKRRAFFSAGIESAKLLQRMQTALLEIASNARAEAKGEGRKEAGLPGTFNSRQRFVAQIREAAISEGLLPDEETEGTLKDITSEARLELIFNTNIQQARGYAYWKRGQNSNVLDGWPAQELIRVRSVRVPRGTDGRTESWPERWARVGGSFAGPAKRMVALKTDAIWERISRFNDPWPPFDFNSGMGIREIDREEAIRLGILKTEEQLAPIDQAFNEKVEATATIENPKLRSAMERIFGEQIQFDGDKAKWRANEI